VPAPPAPQPPPAGPVAPGNYTNHVGNQAAGQWGPDGQWQWHNPQSPEADSTWKYLAAAAGGAAVGGLASYMLTRKQFEQQNPKGWSAASNTREVSTYMDRRGNPISKDEYERRRAQSERDKARHREQQAQRQKQQQYRDKQGRFISKQEYDRRQQQAARDRAKAQQQRSSRSKPRSKPRRSRSRRR
jgi:hypothetical protein